MDSLGGFFQQVLRAVLVVAAVLALVSIGFLVWVALDRGPSPVLAHDPSVLSAPRDIKPENKLNINALCDAGSNGKPTTVEISEGLRNPIVNALLAVLANEGGPWSRTEVAMLQTQLSGFLSEHNLSNHGMLVIARSGLSNLQRLRVINDTGADKATILNGCRPGGEKRREGESIIECVARNWGGDLPPFTYTHTGFLVRHNGDLRVLHTYPLGQHLAFFCEPLSIFLGLPLDERSLLVMVPPVADQKRLRGALEDNLGVQLAEMRYSMTSPHDAPNYSQSNGPAFHGILATTLDGKYDLRDAARVVADSGYKPAAVLIGRPVLARIVDLVVPVIDLTTQPYAKQGLFFSATPKTLVDFVRKRGWTVAEIGLNSWSLVNEKPPPD
jgi:hypothetical protein